MGVRKMKLDSTLSMAAIITSIVTLLLFSLLHYVIEPRKEKKKKKSGKFKELYAPLYMIINARFAGLVKGGSKFDAQRLYFTDAGSPGIIDDNYMIEFFFKNSSYASLQLLHEFDIYVKNVSVGHYSHVNVERLVKLIVKEYQQLRKELKLDYNQKELETGIPTRIKELRENDGVGIYNV